VSSDEPAVPRDSSPAVPAIDAAVTGLGHRLVDGGVEVVTQLVAEFLAIFS